MGFRWPRLSTQHSNLGDEEENGRTSFHPGTFLCATRPSASLVLARLECARCYFELSRNVQRARRSDGAAQAAKERGLPLEYRCRDKFPRVGAKLWVSLLSWHCSLCGTLAENLSVYIRTTKGRQNVLLQSAGQGNCIAQASFGRSSGLERLAAGTVLCARSRRLLASGKNESATRY